MTTFEIHYEEFSKLKKRQSEQLIISRKINLKVEKH